MELKPKGVLATEMIARVFLSPGFYMGFWETCILGNLSYTPEQIKNHTQLQLYRELRVGAILAAANTVVSGRQHFVGIPDADPPDVQLAFQDEVKVNGKLGTERFRLDVEVTRCDLAHGETLLSQTFNKNKPAYRGMVVAIDVDGTVGVDDYQAVLAALQKQDMVYPSEVVAVHSVGSVGRFALPAGAFGVSRLWPSPASTLLYRNDPDAFFRRPIDVIGPSTPARGITTEWQDLCGFTLLPPVI